MDGKKKMLTICEKVTSFKTQEISFFLTFQKWRWLKKFFIRFCCCCCCCCFFLFLLFFHFKSSVCHKNMLLTILRIYSWFFVFFLVVCVVEDVVVCFLFAREFHFICNSLRWMLYSVCICFFLCICFNVVAIKNCSNTFSSRFYDWFPLIILWRFPKV